MALDDFDRALIAATQGGLPLVPRPYDAVGERLQRLAKTTQVLLVTHSPQVAARAARHFRITRIGDKTRVHLLTDDERLEELARMLSGANVTEEARAAARRLVAEAAPKRKKRA